MPATRHSHVTILRAVGFAADSAMSTLCSEVKSVGCLVSGSPGRDPSDVAISDYLSEGYEQDGLKAAPIPLKRAVTAGYTSATASGHQQAGDPRRNLGGWSSVR